RAIALSGLTVGIGLIALVVLPVPGLRSVGIGGMLIPVVSVAVSLTLLPALLGGIGPRVDWPRLRHEQHASRAATAWARLIALPRDETVNSSTLATVTAVRDAMASQPGVVGVSGMGAIELDYSHAVFGNFPLMFTLVALATLLLLTRAFRSLVLAVKAVALNLMSLAATFGLLTWFWQDGHGSKALFGIPATGAITFWIPLMVFAFLFCLSMDYEVFILARIREEYDRTGSTDTAVVQGIGRTGRLVTIAALILFFSFASLASAANTDIKALATGLGAGILLEATVVR